MNQARGWVRKLRRGEDLSNPVLVMLWKIGIERNGVYDVPEIKKDEVELVVESLSPKFPKGLSAEWVDTSEVVMKGSDVIRNPYFGSSNGVYVGNDSHKLNEIMRILQELRLELTSQKKQK